MVRATMPLAYIAAAYWVPALLRWHGPDLRFQGWLVRSDDVLRARLVPLPRSLLLIAEMAYLTCFALVPGACVFVLWTASDQAVARFWTAVLLAGFACYGTLPWLRALPPRAARARPFSTEALPRVNAFVLHHVSHGFTTVPSGHVAVSVAIVGALAPISRPAAVIAGVIAAGVAVGAAAGRYHYLVDVLLGIGVAIVVLAGVR